MEESISLLRQIETVFRCKEVDARAYSPLALAYIGDAVYDLVIRTVVVEHANRSANELHKSTVKFVKAEAQATMIEALAGVLTEEEELVYKRGRNAKPHSTAKNASVKDYRKATGFEALMGYLYLQNRMDRALELIQVAATKTGLLL